MNWDCIIVDFLVEITDAYERIYNSFATMIKIWECKKYFGYVKKAKGKIHFSNGIPLEYRDGQMEYYLKEKQEKYYPESVHGWSPKVIHVGLDDSPPSWKSIRFFNLVIASGLISLALPSCKESWTIWIAYTIAFSLLFASFDMLVQYILKLRRIKIAAECQALREAIEEKRRILQAAADERLRERMERYRRKASS